MCILSTDEDIESFLNIKQAISIIKIIGEKSELWLKNIENNDQNFSEEKILEEINLIK